MKYFGGETLKALGILGENQTPREMIRSYGEVKLAALRAQQEAAGLYPEDYFPLLEESAQEIIRGDLDEHFPLPLAQGGAGTSLHMNICEVLANRSNEKYSGIFQAHPLDHLARFQSTNDTFSTAVIVMTFRFLEETEKQVVRLQEELVSRETVYEEWLLCGRTELQDALPITLGQVYSSWAGPVERDRWRLNKLKERLRTIPLGGTAIGTGFSAPREYVFAAEKQLRRITGYPLCRSQNLCDQVAHTDSLAETASGMALCGENLYKMSSDLLLYTSSLSGEFRHGELQYGSTIMPDKANPVLLELIRGLCMEASSTASLIREYSRSGQLQLNANLPFLAEQMIRLYTRLNKALSCASGPLMEALVPDRKKMETRLVNSPALLNSLKEELGYSGLKELLPQIRAEGLETKEELINWLSKNTELSKEFLFEKFTPYKLTGFTTGGSL